MIDQTLNRELAKHIQDAWTKYLSHLQGSGHVIDRLANELEEACGEGRDLFADDKSDRKKLAIETAKSILHYLVNRAARVFTARGCVPIDISGKAWEIEHLGDLYGHSDWEDIEAFSPIAIWETLESQYGGEKGETRTYSRAACEIVREFGLHRNHETKTRGGCHILNASVWVDALDKKFWNKTALSTHSRNKIEMLCTNLATFARWAGESDQASQLDNASSHFASTRGAFESRERRTLSAAIQVVCYQYRFEFVIRDSLAEKLQVFVSTFASELFTEAAA
jgi:hypothetical protein